MHAAEFGHIEVVKALIGAFDDANALLEMTDSKGFSALMFASFGGSPSGCEGVVERVPCS